MIKKINENLILDSDNIEKYNSEVQKCWDTAFELDMVDPVVRRICKDLWDTKETAVFGLHCFFQLMVLSFYNPWEIAYTKFPDDRGHFFLMNNKKYHEFCDIMFGRTIFHSPDEYCDRRELDRMEPWTVEAYHFYFGDKNTQD